MIEIFDLVLDTNPIDFGNWLQSEFARRHPGVIPLDEAWDRLLFTAGEVIKPGTERGYRHPTYLIAGYVLSGEDEEQKSKKEPLKVDPRTGAEIVPGLIASPIEDILTIEMRLLSENRIQAICTSDPVDGTYFYDWIFQVQSELLRVYQPDKIFYSVYFEGDHIPQRIEPGEEFVLREAGNIEGPWEEIVDLNWDRKAVELWWRGHTAKEISKRVFVTPESVTNRDLPPIVVPVVMLHQQAEVGKCVG